MQAMNSTFNMHNSLLRKEVVALFVFILIFVGISRASYAQTDEEMMVLEMFYKEKDLVVSSTRHPKPISQVAENITVVTAKDIERMNAHTVAEVLNRVPGVFVNFNQDFGASSILQSQGSEDRHVLVLVDGFSWNFLANGAAETNSIPVGIIDRIEIIKGPGSSVWGSSLGGVINIITKSAGTTERPQGTLSCSWGEKNTQDHRGEFYGKAGPVGYYLFAGFKESDGLRESRDFDSYDLYSKFRFPMSKKISLKFTFGYSEPDVDNGGFPADNLSQEASTRTFFATTSIDGSFTDELDFELDFHHFKQRLVLQNDFLRTGPLGLLGSRIEDEVYDEETSGGSARLAWTHSRHTAVLGVDVDYGKLAQTIKAGRVFQLFGFPPISSSHSDLDEWAVYLNDTILIDRWSITAGIRYDDNNVTGSFVSPSLGVSCQLGDHSLLRAFVARGFTIPGLSFTSGGSLTINPNPDLDSEELLSFQLGAETAAFKYFWVKAAFFRHELDDALTSAESDSGFKSIIVNNGESRRQGVELELESISLHNFTFLTGLSYVHITPPTENLQNDIYEYIVGLRYDDRRSFKGELFGHYVCWDLDKSDLNPSDDDFIWDLSLIKAVYNSDKTRFTLFFTAHNLFTGSQYQRGQDKNPERWLEAGMRVSF